MPSHCVCAWFGKDTCAASARLKSVVIASVLLGNVVAIGAGFSSQASCGCDLGGFPLEVGEQGNIAFLLLLG